MRRFVIPSLVAAGFLAPQEADAALPPEGTSDGEAPPGFKERLRLEHRYTLAGHSSHSSHRSHASHRSSSSGGYSRPRAAPTYTPPAPVYTVPRTTPRTSSGGRNYGSTPPSSILPSPPAAAAAEDSAGAAGLASLPGNSARFQEIARQVQVALTAYGYYSGPIDAIIGSGSRTALSKFQTDFGLKVTGTITPEVLDAFGIQAR